MRRCKLSNSIAQEIFISIGLLSVGLLSACEAPSASRSNRNGIADGLATGGTNAMPDFVFQIGTVDAQNGSIHEVFGKIRDLAVDTSGNIFLLDEQALTVQWFDSHGEHRAGTGREGAGPGEFRAPMAIALDGRGRIHVLDAAYQRISVFAPSDNGLVLEDTRQTPLHAIDFCIIADRYYLLAPKPEGIIHEADYAGSLLHTFGANLGHVPVDLKQHSAIIRKLQNRGRLACISSPPTIILLHEHLPVVRAFAPDGSLKWSTTLNNYNPLHWEVSSSGRGLRMAIDPALGSVHAGKYITPLSDSRVAATLSEVDPVARTKTFEVRILSIVDGRQILVQRSPFVMAAIHDSVVVGFKNNPFPRIFGVSQSDISIEWK